MKNFLKLLSFVIIVFAVAACDSVAQEALPTYTPYPTYTDVPTSTPLPTSTSTPIPLPTTAPIATTSIDSNNGYIKITCPSEINPPPGMKGECYVISATPLSIGVLFTQSGKTVVIGIMFDNNISDSIMDDTVNFFIEKVNESNWDLESVMTLTEKFDSTPQDTLAIYGNYGMQWSDDGEHTIIIYMKK